MSGGFFQKIYRVLEHPLLHNLLQRIVVLMEKDESLITFVGDRPGQVFRHTGNIKKIKNALGWEPKTSWKQGLNKTIQWYKENNKWWEKQLWMRAVPIITKDGRMELY